MRLRLFIPVLMIFCLVPLLALADSSEDRASFLFTVISPSSPAIVNIDQEGIPEMDLRIETSALSSQVQVIVASFHDKPDFIPENLGGNVYNYLELTKQNLNDADIANLNLKFKVDREWLDDRQLQVADISLLHFSTHWEKLPTRIVDEDENSVRYSASSPEFGVFAIAADGSAQQQPQEQIVQIFNAPKVIQGNAVRDVQPKEENTTMNLILSLVVVFLGVVGLGVFVIQKRLRGPMRVRMKH